MGDQECAVVSQVNGEVWINGIKIPKCPTKSKCINSTVINGRVFINGYEWTRSGWKKTIRAFIYWLF